MSTTLARRALQQHSHAQPCEVSGESDREKVAATKRVLSTLVAAHISVSALLISTLSIQSTIAQETDTSNAETIGLEFIDTSFENASPLHYKIDRQGYILVFLVYDYERLSPNRAAGHWHFRVQARQGSQQTIIFNNLLNVWNGKQSSIAKVGRRYTSHTSAYRQNWHAKAMEVLTDLRVKLDVTMEGNLLYFTRTEPYRISLFR